ncbi:MAG: Asp-tRNA(Asn)/Glu-tRNA(Gln) amidotransferase GatCAB subunit B, partial [Clostridia bacterium]|nr:Asp-tRNA(Asn)/Glu-tRNA(Gln) amidotransferase GatCAB subunit B [Clostridia bacterium]
ARMEQGSIRVDVNISVMPEGAAEFGTRAEIKNLNSLKAIAHAIEYETSRQSKILSGGGSVTQETRRFDDTRGVTVSMRSKEEAHDYQYFPEPDIPPVFITDEEIANIKNELPELPHKRQRRYTEAYGLSQEDARLITEDRLFSDFYDAAVKEYPDYKQISNLMLVELKRCLNECETGMKDLKFTPPDLAKTAQMAADGIISKNAAREVISIMFKEGICPEQIAKEHGFIMSSNSAETEMIIDKILAENEKQVTDYKNGSEKIFGFLMGKVMREIGGSANPKIVKELLTEKLKQ